MVKFLFEFSRTTYNYFFSSLNVPNEIQKIRKEFSSHEVQTYAQTFNPESFKDELLSLVGMQEEDEAIRLVLKTHLLVTEHVEMIPRHIDLGGVMRFSTPLSPKSLANGRSIQQLTQLLDLDRLSSVISFLSN